MQITILEGATFCVSDELGDLAEPTTGFFDEDTRFLSRLSLTVNGARPLLLSHGKVEYYSAAWFLRNPPVGGLAHDEVSIARRRFVGDGMQEHIILVNHAERRVEFELDARAGDGLRRHLRGQGVRPALGDPAPARAAGARSARSSTRARTSFVFSAHRRLRRPDPGAPVRIVVTSTGGLVRYRIALEPRERWQLRVDVFSVARRHAVRPAHGGAPLRRRARSHPRPRSPPGSSAYRSCARAGMISNEVVHDRSVSDLASLRMRGAGDARSAARLPGCRGSWRSSGATRSSRASRPCSSARSSPRARCTRSPSCRRPRTTRRSTPSPGKIVHEVRDGKGATAWFPRYYGTIDATPLYLILLSEVWRWTDDASLVRRSPRARAPRARLDRDYADLDGDGFVEYHRRSVEGPRESVVEGLRRLPEVRRRAARRVADRSGRGPGVRVRREAPDRRDRT